MLQKTVRYWETACVDKGTTIDAVFEGGRLAFSTVKAERDSQGGQYMAYVYAQAAKGVVLHARQQGWGVVVASGPDATPVNAVIAVPKKVGRKQVQPAAVINAVFQQSGKSAITVIYDREFEDSRLYGMFLTPAEHQAIEDAGGFVLLGTRTCGPSTYTPRSAACR